MPEKCICIECGKEFIVKPYMKDRAKFCSYECMGKHKAGTRRGEWITIICPSCGKEFETLKSKQKKYCSEQCFHDRNELYMMYNCDCCGKEFRIKKSYYQKKLDGKQKTITCSKECSNKMKHTGHEIKCDNCGKLFYQRQYLIDKQNHHFCSSNCESEYKHNQCYEDRVCEICGKTFHVSKKSNQRFCSISCQGKWQSTQLGELNPRFKQEKVECDYCHKEIYVKNYKIKSGQHNFCSSKCRQDWYAETWCQQIEWKDLSRKRLLKAFKDGKMNKINSKPQILVDNLLNKMNVEFEREHSVKYYSIDNYLVESNLMIEVQGDYWHSNPCRFKNKLTEQQFNGIRRDKEKHYYIKHNYDIEILYLWEYDILHNINMCEKLISLYIETKGILKNYHSFNYHINENGELCLKNFIVIPYQNMEINMYKHLKENIS